MLRGTGDSLCNQTAKQTNIIQACKVHVLQSLFVSKVPTCWEGTVS